MSPAAQFTVAGLRNRYTLEGSLRNVFVEGTTDRKLISWFLEEAGVRAQVFEIDAVVVPRSETSRLGLPNNNRGRVMALANLLADGSGSCPAQATFVVDADFDYLFGEESRLPGVLITDGASCETYFFNDPCIRKFFALSAGLGGEEAERVKRQLEELLTRTFLIRAAVERLKLGLEKLEVTKAIEVEKDGSMTFDEDLYLERYLDKNGKRKMLPALKAELETVRKLAVNVKDPRRLIHGHELVDLISHVTRRITSRSHLHSPDDVAIELALSCEFEALKGEHMLALLLSRLRSE